MQGWSGCNLGHQQHGLLQQQQKFSDVLNYQKRLKQMLVELGERIIALEPAAKQHFLWFILNPKKKNKALTVSGVDGAT